MPSKLDTEGKVRNKFPIAWAVAEPELGTRFGVTSELMAGGQELMREVRGTYTVTDSRGKEIKVPSPNVEEEWSPEIIRRYFQPFAPEPIYRHEDLEMVRNSGMKILDKTARDKYVKDPAVVQRAKAFYTEAANISEAQHKVNVKISLDR